MAISGYVALLAGIIVSRIINERGYRTLSADEKVRLMDGFSGQRAYSLIPLVILIAVYYFLSRSAINQTVLAGCYFGLLAIYVVTLTILNHRKMKALAMPNTYRTYFAISQAASMLGIAWFFFTLLYQP
jgi:hypothetical protein